MQAFRCFIHVVHDNFQFDELQLIPKTTYNHVMYGDASQTCCQKTQLFPTYQKHKNKCLRLIPVLYASLCIFGLQ